MGCIDFYDFGWLYIKINSEKYLYNLPRHVSVVIMPIRFNVIFFECIAMKNFKLELDLPLSFIQTLVQICYLLALCCPLIYVWTPVYWSELEAPSPQHSPNIPNFINTSLLSGWVRNHKILQEGLTYTSRLFACHFKNILHPYL